MKPPNTIATSRLLLRIPVLHDADAIFAKYAQDPEVTKYLIWHPHSNINITRDFILNCIQSWETGTSFPWVIAQKSDHEIIGMFELRLDTFRANIGYVIARDYWGLGYATEITNAVIEWALMQESIYRVWATCDTENIASAKVLEKAGMQREGILRCFTVHPNISDKPRDSYCYSIVK